MTVEESKRPFVCGKEIALSPRQMMVVELRASGLLNKQIAARMGISEYTVKEYISAALRKTACRTVGQAIFHLAREGQLR